MLDVDRLLLLQRGQQLVVLLLQLVRELRGGEMLFFSLRAG